MHRGHREVGVAHLLVEPLDLLLAVAEDDGLSNRERVVEVAERIELPLLLLDGDEELLDSLCTKGGEKKKMDVADNLVVEERMIFRRNRNRGKSRA